MARRLTLLAPVLALLPAAPAAAFPGDNGAIAYVATIDGETSLLSRSGTRVRAILRGGALAGPAWSPQGRRLAVVRSGPDGRGLWTVAHDGLGARQVTASATGAADPAWSPTGGEIAFAEGPPGRRDVRSVTADGGAVRTLAATPADEREPAWSAQDRVAYVVRSRRTGDDLMTVPGAGGKARRLTRMRGQERSPSWSPDGRRVAFVRQGAIWTVRSDGRRARRLVRLRSGSASAPAWSPDGRRIVFAAGRPGARRVYSVTAAGRGLRAVSGRTGDAREPDWQPTGFDPLVAAAGDIACAPTSRYFNGGAGVPRQCGQRRTANLLLQADYWNVLPLGDTQDQRGEYENFLQVYDPTWGATKYLQRPVIGNHEYGTGSPTGYFDYFNGVGVQSGPAGDRSRGYYAYDIGEWRVIALNSECRRVPGGCATGSPQQRWLAAELAANPRRCTLAVWHRPRFSSFRGGNPVTADLWRTLDAAGADVVLSAHHQFYERFAPLDATGAADPDGIRQFTVGTGGDSIKDAEGVRAGSQARIETTFGVLRLRLRPTGYEWRFVSASADPATDQGSAACR